MKKYFKILSYEIKSAFTYISNIFYDYIGFLIHIFIFLNLWNYIYSDSSSLIKGYNIIQMIWYVIITEIMWSSLGGRKLVKDISKSIKSGDVVYNLTRPVNYPLYSLFSHLGTVLLKLFIYYILGIFTGFIFLKSFPFTNALIIIYTFLTMILASFISLLVMIVIGEISFFIEDAMPVYWIYSKVILIFGTIFPIELFPSFLQKILIYSPIYVTTYGPAKLFTSFSYLSLFKLIIFQLIYIAIIYFISILIYKKGVKKLNVNGG